MKSLSSLSKVGMVALVGTALASGITALSGTAAVASPPGPDCGPTYQWICEVPGCPDCYIVEFIGTICEVNAYEKHSGRKCHLELD